MHDTDQIACCEGTKQDRLGIQSTIQDSKNAEPYTLYCGGGRSSVATVKPERSPHKLSPPWCYIVGEVHIVSEWKKLRMDCPEYLN